MDYFSIPFNRKHCFFSQWFLKSFFMMRVSEYECPRYNGTKIFAYRSLSLVIRSSDATQGADVGQNNGSIILDRNRELIEGIRILWLWNTWRGPWPASWSPGDHWRLSALIPRAGALIETCARQAIRSGSWCK